MSYVHVNPPKATKTLLLVHGWPSLWSTWSNQIQRFGKDYRLLVPDLRGFGESTHPGDVESSGTMGDLVGDLVCILQKEKVQKAICVGHDWGAQICWEAARMRPELFEAVAGAVVPYIAGAGPFTPVEQLSKYLPHLTYQIYFEKTTKKAVAELNADIRRTLRATLRSVDSPPPEGFLTNKAKFLKPYADMPLIPRIPFFSKLEEDYMVEQYSKQGFDYTLQFYTHGNRFGSWDFAHKQKNFTIPQPALYIVPVGDPVADWPLAARILKSAEFIPQLTTKALGSAHWPQIEQPVEFNDILKEWLDELPVQEKPSPPPQRTPSPPAKPKKTQRVEKHAEL
jgi:soluble epoxide hydrolase/lipid-phosphate phosphatase